MPDDLYTADILRWSGQQADLLRRLARGERVNDAIDWENVAEEVESVGRSELVTVECLLMRAFDNLLQLHCWPEAPAEDWRYGALTCLSDARRRFAPSMREALDLDLLYVESAMLIAEVPVLVCPSRPPPRVCPFTLDMLIVPRPGRPDLEALLAALNRPEPR